MSFLPAQSFGKRKGLREQLARVTTLEDDDERDRERYELMQELEDDLSQAKNFR